MGTLGSAGSNTLGSAGGTTLGSGAVGAIVRAVRGTLDGGGRVVLSCGRSFWKVLANTMRRWWVSVAMGGSIFSACLVSSAAVKSLAAAMMICSRVTFGILKLCGNHFIVPQMRVDAVDGVQML